MFLPSRFKLQIPGASLNANFRFSEQRELRVHISHALLNGRVVDLAIFWEKPLRQGRRAFRSNQVIS
ncbi:hypothetical protein EMIT0P265_180016 [Pseudomonas zeae]